ncbi:hypothetical protein GX48_04209 [Paracoccidioides brasiliensis]|nr:hypothetical protein GX48_04209 [Paracoccidioides brasiliensis]
MVISYLRRLPGDYREPSIFLDAKSSWTFWGPEMCASSSSLSKSLQKRMASRGSKLKRGTDIFYSCMSCQRAMPEQHGPVFPSAEQQPPTQPL